MATLTNPAVVSTAGSNGTATTDGYTLPETVNTEVDVLDATGQKAGTAELPGVIFDAVTNIPLIHQVVVAQRAAARQGTHATKTRGEVRGGGRKPYKQKGTGRARQGSTRAPQFAGGGVVHGPQPRDYSQRTPKKMIQAALRGALSDRARHGRVHVVTGFGLNNEPSTKQALSVLRKVSDRDTFLVVVDAKDDLAFLSLRNAPEVMILSADQLNTYDVLINDDVVFTQTALDEYVSQALGQIGRLKHAPLTESQVIELLSDADNAVDSEDEVQA